MKINKSQLKQIILEEIQSDPEMLKAIGKLTDSIDNLDVSIDFLSAAFTGESGVPSAQPSVSMVALTDQKLVLCPSP